MNPIDPRLQAALDGERDPAELPADLREAYALLISAAELLEATPPPRVSVANRVMTEIRQIPVHVPPHGSVHRVIRWFGRPRAVTLRLRPVWTLALAASLAAMLLLPWQQGSVRNPGDTEGIANFDDFHRTGAGKMADEVCDAFSVARVHVRRRRRALGARSSRRPLRR